MDSTHKALSGLARRFPATAAFIKPVLLPFLRFLPPPTPEEPTRFVPGPKSGKREADDRLVAVAEGAGVGVGKQADGRNVLMLVVSDLRVDPRVEREARALAEIGYRVTVVCPSPFADTQMPPNIEWGEGVDVVYVSVSCGNFVSERPGYIGGQLFEVVERELAGRSFLAVHAHDLYTGYVALAFANQSGAHLVVDFHEWTSENVHWNAIAHAWEPYPADWKAELQALEAKVMSEASAVVTVCDSIADAIAEELGHGRRPEVIRNIPALSDEPTKQYRSLKQQLDLPDDRFVLLWQGGTGPTRFIEPIIAALEFAPECTFVIRGPSLELFGEGYRALAEKIGVSDRLVLCDPVPSRDVVSAARGADAGIWTLPKLCRNFTYALPNKVFEYTASNLVVLAADYPEVRRMVERQRIGLLFDPYDPHSIAAAINRLIAEPELARICRDNTHVALAQLDAGKEWRKLATLYDALSRGSKALKSGDWL